MHAQEAFMKSRSKNPIKRVDVELLGKIIVTIYEHGPTKKSSVARKCNMSYDNCIKYLDFLDLIGFTKTKINDEDLETVILTEHGVQFCKSKLSQDYLA